MTIEVEQRRESGVWLKADGYKFWVGASEIPALIAALQEPESPKFEVGQFLKDENTGHIFYVATPDKIWQLDTSGAMHGSVDIAWKGYNLTPLLTVSGKALTVGTA